jgi:hypothetical protein
MNTINRTARFTGLLYTLMIPLSILGYLYVPEAVVVSQDALATVDNIVAGEVVFRLSMAAALVVQISHIIIVLLLYKILSPVNKTLAVYMVVFMLTSVPITMLNELNNFAMLYLAGGAPYLSTFPADQLGSMVLFFHTLHEAGIFIAQIFWGLWLIPMGWLIIKSEFMPKFLGYILLLVALSYMVDFFIGIVVPQFGIAFTDIIGFAEILLPLWLLIRGVNAEKWANQQSQTSGFPAGQ